LRTSGPFYLFRFPLNHMTKARRKFDATKARGSSPRGVSAGAGHGLCMASVIRPGAAATPLPPHSQRAPGAVFPPAAAH